MGVTGLWTVVQPCARPIKLETLNKKRLAVDASIWIYQFLKAVRDKEGNALRNSHVVGFFRRICKLLFVGIKPVFVFDGGAPALKRQTISSRKKRREGRREDAVRTAGKLLAVQMQRRVEEDAERRKRERDRPPEPDEEEEEELPENTVYVDELFMSNQERLQNRKFKKTDAYHLPALDVSLENMGGLNDPRIMSHEELEDYARQFHTGEDINLYDFSKIDFNSPFFISLPASDRYNILNAARLRSRLRMGYSKDQLDGMFQDRMAFSRFQIERVKERNDLTQRLMNLNGMNGEDGIFGGQGVGRVVGEKGKEYVLVKNDGVEGGWVLGVVGTNKDEGAANKPINIDANNKPNLIDEDDDDDDEFEDVPIEGLNRLPKQRASALRESGRQDDLQARRQAFYESRLEDVGTSKRPASSANTDSLFIRDVGEDMDEELFGPTQDASSIHADEEEELDRAIALSLEDHDEAALTERPARKAQSVAPQPKPFSNGGGRAIAHAANSRSNLSAPAPFVRENEVEDIMDFEAALVASRRAKHRAQEIDTKPSQNNSELTAKASQDSSGFGGPLPFERLDLSKSLFSKKKADTEPEPGGFERESEKVSETTEESKKSKPLPPWFSSEVERTSTSSKSNTFRLERDTESVDDSSKYASLAERSNPNNVIDLDSPGDEGDMEVTGPEQNLKVVDQVIQNGGSISGARSHVEVSQDPKSTTEEARTSSASLQSNLKSSDEFKDPKPDQQSGESKDPESSQSPNTKIPGKSQSSKSPSPDFEDVNIPVLQDRSISDEEMLLPPGESTSIARNQDAFDRQPFEESEDEYSDPEDAELFQQLAAEADEHARFAAELNHQATVQTAADYERELKALRTQQKKDRRDADEVSHIMITECQQLLKLFGLPYITAPMEAEAQCAELVRLNLVDGIVTDDSDTFLFGGTRVYKNMFNQAKFVECYLMADLEKEFALDRQRLIRIAHLLGSDYTEGLPSVGPVTALEIVSEFEDLTAFKEWWTAVQSSNVNQKQAAKNEPTPFRRKFRKNAARIFLPPSFPDPRVDEAYFHPEFDSDQSPFAWGVPDLDALRDYLMATIGWTRERTDEVLVPVIRDMNRREKEGTQSNITNFFSGGVGVGAAPTVTAAMGRKTAGASSDTGAFAPRQRNAGKSKRLEGAFGKLKAQAKRRRETEEQAEEDADDVAHSSEAGAAEEAEKEPAPKKKTRKTSSRK